MPTTPIGTRIWETRKPSSVHPPRIIVPTGSSRPTTSRTDCAMERTRESSRRRRSTRPAAIPLSSARSQSRAFDSRISSVSAIRAAEIARNRALRCALVEVASLRCARRARSVSSKISSSLLTFTPEQERQDRRGEQPDAYVPSVFLPAYGP